MARSTPDRRPGAGNAVTNKAKRPVELTDTVGKARRGDEAAFEILFNLYSRRILNFIHASSGRDEEVSRDLLQDTFLKVHAKLAGLRDETRFESWLYSIASNCCRDHLRKKRREPAADTDLVERTAASAPLLPDEAGIVRLVVARMPEDLRKVFLLKKMEERTFEEIADLLDCSIRTAKYRMKRAWNFLLKELKRRGVRLPGNEIGKD